MKKLHGWIPVVLLIASCGGMDITPETGQDAGLSQEGLPAGDGETSSSSDAWDMLSQGDSTFHLERALALVQGEKTETATSFAVTDAAQDTNFWVMTDAGEIIPGVTSDNDAVSLEISRMDEAPTGEVYLLFEHSLTVDGLRCRWFAVANGEAVCAEPDTRFDITEVHFNNVGDAYYRDGGGEIRLYARLTGANRVVVNAADIGYALDTYIPLDDGSVLLNGTLAGTSRQLYRFIPAVAEGTGQLEPQCLKGIRVSTREGAPRDQYLLAGDGFVYVKGKESLCAELPESLVYRGRLTGEGGLEFEALTGVDAAGFAEDSAGNVYAVGDSWNEAWNFVTPLPAEGEGDAERIEVSVASPQLFAVGGDALFASGESASGAQVFRRRSLLSGEESDIVNDPDLLVQNFEVTEAGDVFFGALDLESSQRLLCYSDSASGETAVIGELPGDVIEILFINGGLQ